MKCCGMEADEGSLRAVTPASALIRSMTVTAFDAARALGTTSWEARMEFSRLDPETQKERGEDRAASWRWNRWLARRNHTWIVK